MVSAAAGSPGIRKSKADARAPQSAPARRDDGGMATHDPIIPGVSRAWI